MCGQSRILRLKTNNYSPASGCMLQPGFRDVAEMVEIFVPSKQHLYLHFLFSRTLVRSQPSCFCNCRFVHPWRTDTTMNSLPSFLETPLSYMTQASVAGSHPKFLSFVFCVFSIVTGYIIYLVRQHPLSNIPGPLTACFTRLWLFRAVRRWDLHKRIDPLHAKYGSIIRVAPNEVWVNDPSLLDTIYGMHPIRAIW